MIPHAGARPVSVLDSQCLNELALVGERFQTPINPFECGETLCEICETSREEGFVCVSTCLYSNWTEMTPLKNASLVTILQSHCLSELAILGERFQQVTSGYECTGTQCIACLDRREVGYICYSGCNYSDWTGVNIINATPVAVPSFKCFSRLAIQGERLQRAISGFECTGTQCERCRDKRVKIYVCNSVCRYGKLDCIHNYYCSAYSGSIVSVFECCRKLLHTVNSTSQCLLMSPVCSMVPSLHPICYFFCTTGHVARSTY